MQELMRRKREGYQKGEEGRRKAGRKEVGERVGESEEEGGRWREG